MSRKSNILSHRGHCSLIGNCMGNIIKNIKIKIHRTIILPVVLYGCATLWVTLRDECRLRVFENTVLRRIFGPKRDKVTGEWRKLHKTKDPDDLYSLSLPNIIW